MSTNSQKNEPKFSIDANLLALKKPEAGLYIVATPIGNLSDISLRALQVMAHADLIACEDTRVTRGLLNRFSIKVDCVAYHEHNAEKQTPMLLQRLNKGETICVVSDAGTPLISDPGYRLVNAALAEGIKVIPIPGPSAPIAALSASGLPTDAFFFGGFLPPKSTARQKKLTTFANIPATLVFFESPKRLAAMLADAAETLRGDRHAVVAREITKLFETFHRGTLSELAAHFAEVGAPKGEIVVLIEASDAEPLSNAEIDQRIHALLGEFRTKEVAQMLADETGLPKRELYARAQTLRDSEGD